MSVKPNELQIIRIYDAPAKLVWEAWTDPDQVGKWWGPRGFTITTKHRDLRVGGQWIYTMHGPDGTDYPNITTYHVVEPYKKLVYDHGGNADRPKLFTVTVTFEEHKGKTTMNMIMALDTAEAAKETKKFIKKAGGNGTWDRLGEHLEKRSKDRDTFIINRSFEADLETVYQMWTQPERYIRWLGPEGAQAKFIRADVRVGGTSQWSMSMGEGNVKHGQLHYKEITPNASFVYTQNFCDEEGRATPAPFPMSYPKSLRTTTTFTEEAPGQTRVTVMWEIDGTASAEERKNFLDMRPVMTEGWSQSFDKIDELLSKR